MEVLIMYTVKFKASEGAVKAIKNLQERGNLKNKAEVLRKAIGALHWMLEQFEKDRRVISVDEEAFMAIKNDTKTKNPEEHTFKMADISKIESDLHLTEN